MVNKLILVGRLTKKPELRETKNGNYVTNLDVATEKTFEGKKMTTFHRVTVWGKTAENCAKYLEKGREIYIEAEVQNRTSEKDGVKQYHIDLVAQVVQFLGGKDETPLHNNNMGFTSDDIPF